MFPLRKTKNKHLCRWISISIATILTLNYSTPLEATEAPPVSKGSDTLQNNDVYSSRRTLYDKISTVTQIPWYRLAAIDQYERTLTKANPKNRSHLPRLSGVYMSSPAWSGALNPDPIDSNPLSIAIFGGIGRDGSGDQLADANNDMDILYSMATYLLQYGQSQNDFSIALWEYYHNSRAVQRIQQFSKLYEKFSALELTRHAFPLPLKSQYSYQSTWGTGRNWGGFRIHEGTDLFAGYGVPVHSTSYGIIEMKGWNSFGGWRIGIRDINNHYHYFAHLMGYEKGLETGDIVTAGQVIGYVGSSGYGKPGTQGKFPPHLHYGIYRDSGLTEWSFDPYPLLHRWEQEERKSHKQDKKNIGRPLR
ncbi:M23 family metallopeptidase [Paenibacillus sp. FA6]|uniref:M23 family metallopeptidase n=1 Tax=Paenibacillus sp. FA6 TaxID=3413029 RepID=UPI003F65A5A8